MTTTEESHISHDASLEKNKLDVYHENQPLAVTEGEAFARARNSPEEALPLCTTFRTTIAKTHDVGQNGENGKSPSCLCAALEFIRAWCTGSIPSGTPAIQSEFGVSAEVTTLCLSLYGLRYAVGPALLAPLSEYFGRQPVYVVSWFLRFSFQLLMALAPNIGTIIVCRFLAGFAGGAPLTNTGRSISDLWERNTSGGPMAIYGLSSTFGPPMALVVSGYKALDLITDASASGRKGLDELFKITLTRLFCFVSTKSITTFSAFYNGSLCGLVYLFNEVSPLVFGPRKGHGFNVGQQGLAFLGMAIGPTIAFCFYPLQERYYLRRVKEHEGKGAPEARLWMARLGAILIPIGLFCYQTYSASALAGVILARNLVGAESPLLAAQMYERWGYEWASSLLGLLAILLVPIPFIFFYMGRAIRLRSPWAREHFEQNEDNPHY
ncbi:hypothetical protein ABOM_008633 [Aspergillus bombycis]|uniref:Polyamine transporter n=1 Tax=Aspergillus bombycis TaxID=109264 RepID=A0A1F7ZVL2_9EURO|nr:hypothetical protein ABOM_008633 [Aspergillus bombycis]OGM43299.1 hypothetical protein ABOM_008633 [Aspergillus bombycis]